MPVDHRILVDGLVGHDTKLELELQNLAEVVNKLEQYLPLIEQLEKHIKFRNGTMILEHTRTE